MHSAEKALQAAIETARAAGAILRESFEKPRQITVKGTAIDIVTAPVPCLLSG
jgi:hypothetical protein